jgi:dTMP kinase
VQQGRQPDLTLWFDLPPDVAAARRAAARDPDRFERQDEAFFTRVREGYAQRSRAAAERFVRVDAMQPVDAVRAKLEGTLESRGW